MAIEFSKIHGTGNDFIVIDELGKEIVGNKAGFAKRFCDRHKGVGADGVLFLQTSKKADFKMRIFNSDGSEAENCINGIRCATLFKFLKGKGKSGKYLVESKAGINELRVIEAKGDKALLELNFIGKAEFVKEDKVEVDGSKMDYSFVNVGNPHAVFFVKEDVSGFDVEGIGHKIEYHRQFAPARVNAEFVNVKSPVKVVMRVHERGACETQACGSGSIAVVVAGIKAGLLKENGWVEVKQPGGSLNIRISGKNVMLRGEAEKAFEGVADG